MSTIFHKSLARTGGGFPRRGLTFFTATCCLISSFMAAAITIPMMAVWRTGIPLSESEMAMTVVSYFAGCVLTLFFFARLSNFFGRKPVVLASLLLGMASSLIYSFSVEADPLYIGRFLQGFSCGFASSAAMSWVVASAPLKHPWLGTALTAAGPNIGLSLGTLITGLVLDSGVLTPAQLFDSAVVLLVLCTGLAFASTETMRFGTEPLGSVFIPKVALPARLRLRFMASAIAFVGTWGVGSFLQGFSAYLSQVVFGHTSPLLAALLYLVLICPNAVMGVVAGRFNAKPTLVIAICIFACAGFVAFATLIHPSVWVLIVSIAICGAGNGASCSSGLKYLLSDTTINERAGVISALYLSAYVGSVIPNLVIGSIPGEVTQTMIANGFFVWVGVTAVGVLGALWMAERREKAAKSAAG